MAVGSNIYHTIIGITFLCNFLNSQITKFNCGSISNKKKTDSLTDSFFKVYCRPMYRLINYSGSWLKPVEALSHNIVKIVGYINLDSKHDKF